MSRVARAAARHAGGQLQGRVATAIKPVLIGAGWSDAEEAPWKLQVEHWLEKIESDEVRRRRLLARARIVDRYRTMMKQLRENERFVSEERTKLYRPRAAAAGVGRAAQGRALRPRRRQRELRRAHQRRHPARPRRQVDGRVPKVHRAARELRALQGRRPDAGRGAVLGQTRALRRPATGLPGPRTAAAKLGDVVGKVDPTLGNSIGQMFGREYEAVDPECQVGSARGPTARTATRRAGSRRAPTATAPSAR